MRTYQPRRERNTVRPRREPTGLKWVIYDEMASFGPEQMAWLDSFAARRLLTELGADKP